MTTFARSLSTRLDLEDLAREELEAEGFDSVEWLVERRRVAELMEDVRVRKEQ